jgi:hypothetical protein
MKRSVIQYHRTNSSVVSRDLDIQIYLILIGVCILFIIGRGIEYGDLKSQKWLTSILSGFFSSILLTEPLKVKFFFLFFLLI